MKNLIIVVLSIVPVFAEIIYDKYMWSMGIDDKPSSTYYRVLSFIIIAGFIGVTSENFLLYSFLSGLFLWATHLLLFNPILNLFRGKKLFYRKDGEIWNSIPIYGEYFFKLVILYSTWAALFHWDWITTGAPSTLIEYFMF